MPTYTRDQCFSAAVKIVEGLNNGGNMMETPVAVMAELQITDQEAFNVDMQAYEANADDAEYVAAIAAFKAACEKAMADIMAAMMAGQQQA